MAMMKLLLVEDNEDNARALARLLARRGFEVSVAATGAEALAKAEEVRPAVVLMDIGLPDMDGLEATRRLKQVPDLADIPVIALTAHAMAEDMRAAVSAGCTDFAAKPVDLTVLLSKIASVTSARDSGPENSS